MDVLSIIVGVLIVLWLLGYFGHAVIGGFPAMGESHLIHLLLVVAVIVLIFRLLRGRI